MNILYLEDDTRDAELTRHVLKQTAPTFSLNIAVTLHDAFVQLGTQSIPPYDLVLADMRLPDGNGLDLLGHIRAHNLPLAVVMITGLGDEESVVTALRSGADDYVVKRGDYLERLPITLHSALVHYRINASRRNRPLRVLYADHNGSDIDLIRRHLARHAPHIRIESVHTVAQLLSLLPAGDQCDYDLLLLDYRLPSMNGIEVLKELRQSRALILPIVFITGQGGEEVAAHALKLGAADYLIKGNDYLYRMPAALENAYLRADLEMRVRERTADLANANQELEAFSYSVSHDLRAPLRAIDGFSKALMEDYGETLNDTAKDYLQRIRLSTHRMGDLIQNLMELSRVSRTPLAPIAVDLSEIATSVMQTLRDAQPNRTVAVNIVPQLVACADSGLMTIALDNLLSNAWKFTAQSTNATIEFGSSVVAGMVTYYIKDNGVGFDAQYVGNLFIPFQRLHSTEEFPGTGVGLATVARIIQRHGGRVWAEAEINRGAVFYFTLS